MSIRVLIVDDSALIRELLSRTLAKDGDIVVVGTAQDPIEALEERMRADGLLDDAKVEEIDARSTGVVEDAYAYGRESPLPEPADALTNVFAT